MFRDLNWKNLQYLPGVEALAMSSSKSWWRLQHGHSGEDFVPYQKEMTVFSRESPLINSLSMENVNVVSPPFH